jgi:deoxyribodipyrimidine photolyase
MTNSLFSKAQFSKLLIDCCYANNYGNWNNTLGPYDVPGYRYGKLNTKSGRLYDPTNSKKIKEYDIHLEIIRKYIHELSDVPDKDVFNWYKNYVKYPNIKLQLKRSSYSEVSALMGWSGPLPA